MLTRLNNFGLRFLNQVRDIYETKKIDVMRSSLTFIKWGRGIYVIMFEDELIYIRKCGLDSDGKVQDFLLELHPSTDL